MEFLTVVTGKHENATQTGCVVGETADELQVMPYYHCLKNSKQFGVPLTVKKADFTIAPENVVRMQDKDLLEGDMALVHFEEEDWFYPVVYNGLSPDGKRLAFIFIDENAYETVYYFKADVKRYKLDTAKYEDAPMVKGENWSWPEHIEAMTAIAARTRLRACNPVKTAPKAKNKA